MNLLFTLFVVVVTTNVTSTIDDTSIQIKIYIMIIIMYMYWPDEEHVTVGGIITIRNYIKQYLYNNILTYHLL